MAKTIWNTTVGLGKSGKLKVILDEIQDTVANKAIKQVTQSVEKRLVNVKSKILNIVNKVFPAPEHGEGEWTQTYEKAHAGPDAGSTTLSVKDTYRQAINTSLSVKNWKSREDRGGAKRKNLKVVFGDEQWMMKQNPHWVYYEYGGVIGEMKARSIGGGYKPRFKLGDKFKVEKTTIHKKLSRERETGSTIIVGESLGLETYYKQIVGFIYSPKGGGTRRRGGGVMVPIFRKTGEKKKDIEKATPNMKKSGFMLIQPRHILAQLGQLVTEDLRKKVFLGKSK